jgi:hypothetical protein
MRTICVIGLPFLLYFFATNNSKNMYIVKTPDGDSFSVSLLSKSEADILEDLNFENILEDPLLPTNHRPAYRINDGRILYRQFYGDIGFVFPSTPDYQKVVRGKSYWSVNIQPTDNNNSLIVSENNYTRVAVSFDLDPTVGNKFKKDIIREITEYDSFEGYRFYLLTNDAVILLRNRTTTLSEGYWFPSFLDFDFFYYVLSGKERPKISVNA